MAQERSSDPEGQRFVEGTANIFGNFPSVFWQPSDVEQEILF